MKVIRVREHVNPLGKKYQEAIAVPNWQEIYSDFSLPLSLDIGCGKGEYILKMAQLKPDWNWLGLEIREPLVDRAIAIQNTLKQNELELKNLHYLFCNVNACLTQILPANSVSQVSIQFPDPWFKRRQHKRRTVQPQLVTDLAKILVPNAQVLLQSDIHAVAKEMLKYFESDCRFINLAGAGNFAESDCYPDHVSTDREDWTQQKGGDIYRSHLRFNPS